MKRTIAFVSAALLMASMVERAGAEGFSLKGVSLKDWTAKGEIRKVVGQKLYDLIDGFADIHMGFAYADSEHLTIRKGKYELEVSVFRVNTPDNAYGLYSCLRDREGELLDLPDEASYAYGTVVLWRGPYCVEIKDVSEEEAPKEEILAVCKAIDDRLEGQYQPPELVRAFPKANLVYNGLIYFHHRHPLDQIYYTGTENVLLLGTNAMKSSEVEATYAEYKLPRGSQGVLALRYPKAEEARKALDLYTASLRADLASTDDQPPWRTLTGKNGKTTVAFQKDRLLILALETTQAEAMKAIVEKIAEKLEPKKKPQEQAAPANR